MRPGGEPRAGRPCPPLADGSRPCCAEGDASGRMEGTGCPRSSADQSSRLLSGRSQVRILPGVLGGACPPHPHAFKASTAKAVPALEMKWLLSVLSDLVNQRPETRWLARSQAAPFFTPASLAGTPACRRT